MQETHHLKGMIDDDRRDGVHTQDLQLFQLRLHERARDDALLFI